MTISPKIGASALKSGIVHLNTWLRGCGLRHIAVNLLRRGQPVQMACVKQSDCVEAFEHRRRVPMPKMSRCRRGGEYIAAAVMHLPKGWIRPTTSLVTRSPRCATSSRGRTAHEEAMMAHR